MTRDCDEAARYDTINNNAKRNGSLDEDCSHAPEDHDHIIVTHALICWSATCDQDRIDPGEESEEFELILKTAHMRNSTMRACESICQQPCRVMPCHAVRCNLDVSVSFAWRFSDGMQSMNLEPHRHILIHYFSASDSFTPAEPEHTLTQNGKTRRQCTACTDRCVRTDLDMHQNAVVLKQIPFVGRALGSRA